MIFRKQILHNDCYRTVLGCLTDKEPHEVPHFMEEFNESFISLEAVDRINAWLHSYGLDMITVGYPAKDIQLDELLNYIQETQGSDIIYLLCGMSVLANHVVICRGNKIIWDPSPVNSGIQGPFNNTYFVHYISTGFVRYNGPLPQTFEIITSADDREDSNELLV